MDAALMVVDSLESQEQTGKPADSGLDFQNYMRYCEEIRQQPAFRSEMDKCAEYYDGNQLDGDTLDDLESKGLGPLITNIIRPTIDVVLGMEAKTRSDWRVIADADQWQDVAEAQSAKIHEAERESRADRACSDAYAGQIKAGLGWVEVGRHSDPFKYPYRARAVHRREIFWDWLSQEHDLSDARYLLRKKSFDRDEVAAHMPQHADLIRSAGGGWSADWLERASRSLYLAQALDMERGWSLEDYEWRDVGNNRVTLTEGHYARTVRGYVLRLPDGRTVEMDLNNPAHAAAVSSGRLKPIPAVYTKWNRSIWMGPHKLSDSPRMSKRHPYIPFFGYREDLTGVPYGLIRSMISPQDEANARRRKLLWLMSAKRVEMDADSLSEKHNSIQQMLDELARPDAVVVLNQNRKNANAFRVDHNMGLAQQQFEVLQANKAEIQEAAGVYNAMLGRESGSTSGLAINSLVEQGTTTLAEINDNYRFSRRLVGEALLDLISEDMIGQQVDVMTGESGKRKIISLNKPTMDPALGVQVLQNDVSRAQTKVALEDVPSTPAYRAQQQTMLGEVMKSLPPQLQAIIAPFYLEATELPKRRDIADLLRKQLGMSQEEGQGSDPEKAEMLQAIEQLQAQLQEAQNAPALQEMTAKIEKLLAEAAKTRAEAYEIVERVEAVERQERAMGIPENDPIEQEIEQMVFAAR